MPSTSGQISHVPPCIHASYDPAGSCWPDLLLPSPQLATTPAPGFALSGYFGSSPGATAPSSEAAAAGAKLIQCVPAAAAAKLVAAGGAAVAAGGGAVLLPALLSWDVLNVSTCSVVQSSSTLRCETLTPAAAAAVSPVSCAAEPDCCG